MFKKIKNKSAFTLLEVIIAVVILTIAAWSIYTLSTQTKKIMNYSEYRITAMYLTQEWLEYVRNIRDNELKKSLNRDNPDAWWNKFLIDLWYWKINNWKYENIDKWWYKIKKLEIQKNWIFKLLPAWKDFEKVISSVDDICSDVWEYKNCIYEYINLKNDDKKISWVKSNLWKNFFRKIKISKNFWETNLITVYSEIFWEDHGKLENFILEEKLWNIATY